MWNAVAKGRRSTWSIGWRGRWTLPCPSSLRPSTSDAVCVLSSAQKNQELDDFYHGHSNPLVGGGIPQSRLAFVELSVRYERERSIGTEARALGEFTEAPARLLLNSPMLSQGKTPGLERRDSFNDRGQLLTDVTSSGPELKERGKSIQLVAEGASDQKVPTGTHHSMKLTNAGAAVTNMVENVREPREVTALRQERKPLAGAGDVTQVVPPTFLGRDTEHAA